MSVAVYLCFLLFNSFVFPPLFLKLKNRIQIVRALVMGFPPPIVIGYCMVDFA